MKTAAVVIDNWKLSIFSSHLEKAGYSYEVIPGLTGDSLVMKVKFEWVANLQPVIKAAEAECAASKSGSKQ